MAIKEMGEIMWEKIGFIMSSIGSFLWPLLKQWLVAAAPVVKEVAMGVVRGTLNKYANDITTSNTMKHEDAFSQAVDMLAQKGLKLGADYAESMLDSAIAAAVKQLK